MNMHFLRKLNGKPSSPRKRNMTRKKKLLLKVVLLIRPKEEKENHQKLKQQKVVLKKKNDRQASRQLTPRSYSCRLNLVCLKQLSLFYLNILTHTHIHSHTT